MHDDAARLCTYAVPMSDDWQIHYVRHVLKELGDIAPSALAQRAGISPTTLTRPLSDKNHKFDLSLKTITKIADATGISPTPFMSEADARRMLLSGVAEPDVPYRPGQANAARIEAALDAQEPRARNTAHDPLNRIQIAFLGDRVQVAGTYDREGIDKLIARLAVMRDMLED